MDIFNLDSTRVSASTYLHPSELQTFVEVLQ